MNLGNRSKMIIFMSLFFEASIVFFEAAGAVAK